MAPKDVSEGVSMEDFCPMSDAEVEVMNAIRDSHVSDIDGDTIPEWTESDAARARERLSRIIIPHGVYAGNTARLVIDYRGLANLTGGPRVVVDVDLIGRVSFADAKKYPYDA